ncbi:hypothetical protein Tco_1338527 [Tanacetum coccineum]
MEDGIFFNQSKYIKEMLKKFGLEDSKPTKTPMSTEIKLTMDDEADSVDSSKYRGMIGSLFYLTASRPDIMFSVCLCARFQENSKTTHLEAVKRIFRYIRGTSHLGLWYPKGTGIETVVYADSDPAGDYVDRKSTSGVCTFMRCCLTSWFAKKQMAIVISTIEAEYVSTRKACQQALWMKQAFIDYGIRLEDVPIMCDNKGAIDLSKNLVQHSRTKHIEIRHHFLRDNVQKGNISIEKVASEDNISDIFTKPLKREVPKCQAHTNYRTLESRYVHEGRTIDPSFYNDLSDDSVAKFTAIGICIYSDAWGLDELKKTLEQIEPYNSRLLAIDDIRNLIHRRTVHEKVDKEGNIIHKLPNQIKTNELLNHLRPCELVIRENVYFAIGNRDQSQAVIALMLYCLQNEQPFNLAYFIIRRMYFFRDRKDNVLPYGMILTRLFRNLKANMVEHPFDARYKLVPRKMSLLKAKQPKKPPPKRTRNVGKSKCAQLSTSSSTKSPPSDYGDLPSTNLSPRSYSRALKDDPNMSKEQRETRGMFKNLGRALHNFERMLKKGCR